MKKLATLTAVAALVLGFGNAALAGGASDSTTGDGWHCYLWFEDVGAFAAWPPSASLASAEARRVPPSPRPLGTRTAWSASRRLAR